MNVVHIYTDGSSKGNGGEKAIGGWGYVILENCMNSGDAPLTNKTCKVIYEDCGKVSGATNQQMELKAAIEACNFAFQHLQNGTNSSYEIFVYSDSAYLVNCYQQEWYKAWMKNGWVNSKKQPVANASLWEKLIPYFTNPSFKFKKVAGHSDNYWNNYVDRLATKED